MTQESNSSNKTVFTDLKHMICLNIAPAKAEKQ